MACLTPEVGSYSRESGSLWFAISLHSSVFPELQGPITQILHISDPGFIFPMLAPLEHLNTSEMEQLTGSERCPFQ